jgi:hypothetical protein
LATISGKIRRVEGVNLDGKTPTARPELVEKCENRPVFMRCAENPTLSALFLKPFFVSRKQHPKSDELADRPHASWQM